MATERVYHPETCEPFDVIPSKAALLVLEKGWSRSPWTRVLALKEEPPVVIEDEALHQAAADAEVSALHAPEPAPPGRGRRRRDAVVALDDEVDTTATVDIDDEVDTTPTEDTDASWRS